jgi:hypothetical protein
VFFVFVCGVPTNQLLAQKKYYPDHPVVEAIANKAAEALHSTGRSGKIGEATLVSLALLQHGKRYRQVVPKDDQIINATVARIVDHFPPEGEEDSGGGHMFSEREMYFPSLALILLAEYDSKKYAPEIKRLIGLIRDRQRPNGAWSYTSESNTADTSQSQYAALALFVAKQHNFSFEPEIAARALNWYCQTQQPGGIWVYKLNHNQTAEDYGAVVGLKNAPLSLQPAAAGTIYLLADLLQLNKRVKSMSSSLAKDVGLPKTVSPFIKPIDNEVNELKREGPLVRFDRGLLARTNGLGNNNLEKAFVVKLAKWSFYYLYAMERYAYFREQAEGDLGNGRMENWYDQTVEYIQEIQDENGAISIRASGETTSISTAFALLVLVRSSEVLVLPSATGLVLGGQGFKEDTVIRKSKSGRITGSNPERDLADMMAMLRDKNISQDQLRELTESLKRQIKEFQSKDGKSRGEVKSFLRGMIGAKDYYRRLIAVRFLAGEQDMDNVPALLYALGDPDFRICLEAHNGLRLISRKIDSISVSDLAKKNALRDPGILEKEPDLKSRLRLEFDTVKKTWTEWFLKIRPGAELFD